MILEMAALISTKIAKENPTNIINHKKKIDLNQGTRSWAKWGHKQTDKQTYYDLKPWAHLFLARVKNINWQPFCN